MIKLENLSRDWKEFKIDDITLEVEDREYFIFLGPSGSGKTMLLELIAGMWSPDSGKIIMNNKDVTRLPPENRGVGFVYQNYMLFPNKWQLPNRWACSFLQTSGVGFVAPIIVTARICDTLESSRFLQNAKEGESR